jgi:hypothetical protein
VEKSLDGFPILGGDIALAYGMNRYEPLGNRLIVNARPLSTPVAFVFSSTFSGGYGDASHPIFKIVPFIQGNLTAH